VCACVCMKESERERGGGDNDFTLMRFAKFTALFELLSEKYCVLLFVIVLKK